MQIETIQRLKLLATFGIVVGVLVWNSDSIYRFLIIDALVLTVIFASVRRHQNIVKRTFEQHGFRHVAFHSVFGGPELPSVWWHTYIEKHGAISCATGEEMEYRLAIEGISWALFCPTMTCRVSLIENQTSEEIAHVLDSLRELKCLTYLDCQQSNITDDHLKKLETLQSVELLSLRHTSVTDAGLESVKQLTNLQHLDLTRTKTTDEGLKQLKDMKSLRDLDLSWTQNTDEGLNNLNETPLVDISSKGQTRRRRGDIDCERRYPTAAYVQSLE